MFPLLALLTGVAWGTVLGIVLWPRPDGTLLSHAVSYSIQRQLGRLDTERRLQLQMAGIPVERVTQWITGFFTMTAILLSVAMLGAGLGLFGILVAVVIAGFVGWSVPLWSTIGPYRKWQREVAIGLPAFVTFLPIYLRTGNTPLNAMQRAAALCPEPFRGIMQQALRTVEGTGSPDAAFDSLIARAGIPELDQILSRLTLLWNQTIRHDVLDDMNGQFDAVREVALVRSTTAAKSLMIGVGFMVAIAVLLLVGGVFVTYIASHVGATLGG